MSIDLTNITELSHILFQTVLTVDVYRVISMSIDLTNITELSSILFQMSSPEMYIE